MTNLYAIFQFGLENGYIEENPFKGVSPLREERVKPDPLSREEFVRLIDACRHLQTKNMMSVAVYTGIRPGELCALSWEDIDLKAGTLMVREILPKANLPPKTQAGTNRVIHLIEPAIQALRSQAELTRLGRNIQLR
jgi:integrase